MACCEQKLQERIGIVLLLSAVILCLIMAGRAVSSRYLLAGDSFWHYSNELHLLRSLRDGQGFFGCFTKGFGIPLLNFYQPLLYVAVAGVYLISFTVLSPVFIHGLLIALLFSAYPVSVYYMCRSFRYTALTSGIISFLTLLPVSGWGHTLDAYFYIGLHTQLPGAVLLPVALGALHRVLTRQAAAKSAVILCIAFAGCILAHAVLAVLCGYCVLVYTAWFVIWRGMSRLVIMSKRLVITGIIVAALTSFWLVPFLQFNSEYKFIPETERSFSPLAVSVTTKDFLNNLLAGNLLDSVDEDSVLFGGGEEGLRWSMNSGYYRFSIFTILSLTGFFLCLFKLRRVRDYYFVLLFLASVCLFIGKDDIPWLRMLPFSDQFQPVRAIILLELTCCVFAGVSVTWFMDLIRNRLNEKTVRFKSFVPYAVLLILFPPVYERVSMALSLVAAGTPEPVRELENLYSTLPAHHPADRIYYGRATGISQLSYRALADCFFLNSVTGHDNDMAGSMVWNANQFQYDIPVTPQLIELFNVKTIITSRDWQRFAVDNGQYPVHLKRIFDGRMFSAYDTHAEPLFFFTYPKKPVLVYCDRSQWFYLNRKWLSLFTKYGFEIAPLVKWDDSDQRITPDIYSAVMLIDFPENGRNKKVYEKAFNSFILSGGVILSNKPVWQIPVQRLMQGNKELFEAVLLKSALLDKEPNIVSLKDRWYAHSASIQAGSPAYICGKTAFYKTWNARSAKSALKTCQISPFFTGILVNEPDMKLQIAYRQPVLHIVLGIVGGIVVLLAFIFRFRLRSVFESKIMCRYYHFRGLAAYRSVFVGAVSILIFVFAIQYLAQAALGSVSVIYPYAGQAGINPYEVVFRWNSNSVDESYQFQLAEDKSFMKVIFSPQGHSGNSLGYRGLKPYTRYYWRVRAVRGGKSRSWSDTGSFTTGTYFPVAID
ncbi:MAG: hypothetical protein AB1454_01340 [Candidatus Auribacterota bacterium]